jgi:diadenosine tetraphosphate (Ap4A) HIT family hydrolase
MSFALDERLARDTFAIGDMRLSRVLLMNDARWPWLILVPRREGAVELTDLDADDRALLIEEAASAARLLKAHTSALRINICMSSHATSATPPGPALSGGMSALRPTVRRKRGR